MSANLPAGPVPDPPEPPPADVDQADYEALAQYRYAIRRFLRFSEAAARKAGLTPRQHQLLLSIKGYPGGQPPTVGEIAERLQLDHHTTVGLIDRSERRGLVQRKHSTEDRRQVHVSLTSQGTDILGRLAGLHRAELWRMSEDLRPPGFIGPASHGRSGPDS